LYSYSGNKCTFSFLHIYFNIIIRFLRVVKGKIQAQGNSGGTKSTAPFSECGWFVIFSYPMSA
ncbi:MAG: hypothetical protein JW915_01110, partial [Chitinispirillaceae bacterium]|nr:hypothetical protein [Chitinispirillaceae bacterium]